MAVTVREVQRDAATSQRTFETGAGTEVDDVLVLYHGTDFYAASGLLEPSPGDWTLFEVGRPDETDNIHAKVWVRVVTSAGANTVETNHTPGDSSQHAHLYVLAGADPDDPVSGSANASSFGAAMVATGVDGVDEGLLICGWIVDASPTALTPPGSMSGDDTDSGFSVALVAVEALTATGATGNRTADSDPARTYTAVTVAIRPATGPPPEPELSTGKGDHPNQGWTTRQHLTPLVAGNAATAAADYFFGASTPTAAADDAAHQHTADQPAITQVHALAAADAAHGHTADQPVLTQVQVVQPDSASHGHAADAPTVDQAHLVEPGDAAHGHTVDQPAVTQVHHVAAGDALHGHTADAAGLTQVHEVAPVGADHGHTAEAPALTQLHELAPADATHGHLAEQPVIVVGAVNLDLHSASHTHQAAAPALSQVHAVAAADALHAHTAGQVALTQLHLLATADATHAHLADQVAIGGGFTVDPAPPDQTYTVPAEARVALVAAEDRTFELAAQTRLAAVATASRTSLVAAEQRLAVVPAEDRTVEVAA